MNISREKENVYKSKEEKYIVATFYKFVPLKNLSELKSYLYNLCQNLDIFGTILLAPEGINGTIAGTQTSIKNIFN